MYVNTHESSTTSAAHQEAPLLPAWMTGVTNHVPEYWHRLGQLVFRNMAVLLAMIAYCPTGFWGLLALEYPRWSLMALLFIVAFVVQCVALQRWDKVNLVKSSASLSATDSAESSPK